MSGDAVEQFTGAPRCRGNLPQRSVIVGVGPPFDIGRLQSRPFDRQRSFRAPTLRAPEMMIAAGRGSSKECPASS